MRIVRPDERRSAEVLARRGGERLIRALEDPLRADVDPRARGHLPEHRQALGLEPPELVPGRPSRHEQRVRDQNPRRVRRRTEDRDGLARLHEQRLVVAQVEQRAHDRLERLVRPGRLAAAAVDHELLRPLRDLAVEVVQEHAERRLGRPRSRVQLRPAWRADRAQVAAERLDGRVERRRRSLQSFFLGRSLGARPAPGTARASRRRRRRRRRPRSPPRGRPSRRSATR